MINEYYANKEIINMMIQKLKKDHVIELQQFTKPEFAQKISREVKKLRFQREEKLMSHSYGYSTDKRVLSEIVREIIPFIIDIMPIKNLDLSIVKFEHKDYILIHEKKQKTFILDLTQQWSDAFGGQTVFSNMKGENIIINQKFNSLILSDDKRHMFIKYINNKSKKIARYVVVGRFE